MKTIVTEDKAWVSYGYPQLDINGRLHFVGAVSGDATGSIITLNVAGINNDSSNRLVTGGIVTWSGTGLIFDVTPATYYINNILHSSTGNNIILSASDATFDRIDVIGVNSDGNLFSIRGVAELNPITPQVDNSTQLDLTTVYVVANSTTPGNVTASYIYNENTEWSGSAVGLTVNFNNTSSVFIGSKAVDVGAFTNADTVTFTTGSIQSILNYSVLKLYIRLKSTLATTANIRLSFMSGSTTVSNLLTLDTTYNFDKSIVGAYQNISVPLNAFAFTSISFNKLQITLNGANTLGFFLDYVSLQSGIVLNSNINLIGDVIGTGLTTIPTILSPTGVVPGSYTRTNLTVDAKGRIISASNGSGGGVQTVTGTTVDNLDPLNPIINSVVPRGSDTQFQFNDSGAFNGTTDGVFDKTGDLTKYGFGYTAVGSLPLSKVSVKGIPNGLFGPEEITNGGFIGNDSGWTHSANWTYGTNNIIHSAVNDTDFPDLRWLGDLVVGETYHITYTKTGGGSYFSFFGGGSVFSAGGGLLEFDAVYNIATPFKIGFSGTSGFNNTISGVSVKRVLTTALDVKGISYFGDLSGGGVQALGVDDDGKLITIVGTPSATASYVTASSVFGPYGSNSVVSSSLAQTASYVLSSISSSRAVTASYVLLAQTASYITTSQTASYVQTSQTASYVTLAQTASYVLNAISASRTITASYVTASNISGPYGNNSVTSASYAVTASYVIGGGGGANIGNSDLTVTGNRILQLAGNTFDIRQSTALYFYLDPVNNTSILKSVDFSDGAEVGLQLLANPDNTNFVYTARLYTDDIGSNRVPQLLLNADAINSVYTFNLGVTNVGVDVFGISGTTTNAAIIHKADTHTFNGAMIFNNVSEYADNAAALGASLAVGTVYRTGDFMKIVH